MIAVVDQNYRPSNCYCCLFHHKCVLMWSCFSYPVIIAQWTSFQWQDNCIQMQSAEYKRISHTSLCTLSSKVLFFLLFLYKFAVIVWIVHFCCTFSSMLWQYCELKVRCNLHEKILMDLKLIKRLSLCFELLPTVNLRSLISLNYFLFSSVLCIFFIHILYNTTLFNLCCVLTKNTNS